MNLQIKSHYFILILIIIQIILIKSEQPTELKNEIPNYITNLNLLAEAEIIESLSDNGGIYSTEDDYSFQISFIGSQSHTTSTGVKFPQVNVTSDCINTIKEQITGTKDIIVIKLFTTYTLDINSANYLAGITKLTDVIYYQFFPFINNKIDTSQPIDISSLCDEDVVIAGPLYIDDILKNKFVAVAGQNPKSDYKNLRNYDIFDPNSKIYKDICYPITFSNASENIISKDAFKNYDITLQERKKHYFPGNLYLCPEDCSYLGTDKDTVSTLCLCEFNTQYSLTGSTVTVHTTYTNFNFDEKKFNKAKKDNYFSMETFKCIKLPFTKSGFKGNYGSIIMIAIICIVLLSYIILIISGKYHLLSVLELLYNSNIRSMNYIKNQNNAQNNAMQIPYDARSNNLLISSQRGIATNGLMMSSILTGNNFINGTNNNNNYINQIHVSKRTNSGRNNGVNIVGNNALNKNKANKEKNNLINVDEIQENDYESDGKDKTDIHSMSKNDLSNINSKTDKNDNKQENKNQPKNAENSDEEISSIDKNKSGLINSNNKFNKINNNKDNKNEVDEEEEEEDDDDGKDNKANPPRKKKGADKSSKTKLNENKSNQINENENLNDNEENENKSNKKKRKSKTPIEIALNVKELRDMMLENMPQGQKPENGNTKSPKPQTEKTQKNNFPPQQNNGLNFNPFLNPLNFMPPPYPFNYNNNSNNNNEDKIRREYEDRARQRELEYIREKELADMREKERRREMEDLRERERQRQRDLDYERERRQRDDLYRNLDRDRDRYYDKDRCYDKEKNEELIKEKEKLNQQNEEIKKMKEKLQKEYDDIQNKDREKDLEIQKQLANERDLQKQKEIEYEKELLKQKDSLKEQFEKEKKELIEQKDKEIEKLKEEKDREIQRLKEDKDREIKYMKEDLDREKKSLDEKIKKKDKEFKKEKQKLKEMQKMTSNSFLMNGINANTTMQQQMMDMNNSFNKPEKVDTPQIVVPIDSIFTDQELNAMDYNNSIIYDKRTLCQVYMSYINRKHPLFFLFNYNSSSSNSVSTFQISYKSVKFLVFCVELMIYMFFYATFFGSKSITQILHGKFNFRRKLVFGVILSPFCMIAKSIIHHFVYDSMNAKIAEIKIRCYTNFIVGKKPEEVKVNEFKEFWESDEDIQKNIKEEKKEEMADIQEIENDNLPEEEKIKRKEKYEKRKLKTLIKELIDLFKRKIYLSFFIMLFVLFIMWYYISAFCSVYKNSQLVFFVNILISYGYSNVIPFIYCLLPTIFRQEAVKEESRFAFFIAQIFHIL